MVSPGNLDADTCAATPKSAASEWHRHNGGPNPAPGGLVDLIWGYGVVERQPSSRVNWSFRWSWKPSA